MKNTYEQTDTLINENSLSVETCDPTSIKCGSCVWAYVFGHIPTDAACGQYGRKPKRVYFDGAECPKYRELENRPKFE